MSTTKPYTVTAAERIVATVPKNPPDGEIDLYAYRREMGMPQLFKPIEARLIEFRCERCEIGVFRATGGVEHVKGANQRNHKR